LVVGAPTIFWATLRAARFAGAEKYMTLHCRGGCAELTASV